MVDAVRPVGVSNDNYGNYAAAGLLTGAGVGAAGGGLYGYLSKPWVKDGELTDKFVRQAANNFSDYTISTVKTNVADLKKLSETGAWDSISESSKKLFQELAQQMGEAVGSGVVEGNKAYAKRQIAKLLTEEGVETLDDAVRNIENFYKSQAKILDLGITANMSKEELIKVVAKNPDVFEIVKEGSQTIEEAAEAYVKKTGVQNIIDRVEYKNSSKKNRYTEFFDDVSKGVLKELPEWADDAAKEDQNIIKKSMKQLKWKTAGKCAGIIGGSLATVGLLIGATKKKEAPADNQEGLNVTA
jgi:gas vesicle protein